jgi:thiol peroxidase
MASITLRGNPCTTNGELPAVGSEAPDFRLTDKRLNDLTLADFAGRKKIISTVPSLDTAGCAKYTKIFDEKFAGRDDVALLVVSADLPFAQDRFCGINKTASITTLSLMRSKKFAKDYGILLQDGPLAGLCARSVTVLDENNRILHTELVNEISQEPDFDAAMAALD